MNELLKVTRDTGLPEVGVASQCWAFCLRRSEGITAKISSIIRCSDILGRQKLILVRTTLWVIKQPSLSSALGYSSNIVEFQGR